MINDWQKYSLTGPAGLFTRAIFGLFVTRQRPTVTRHPKRRLRGCQLKWNMSQCLLRSDTVIYEAATQCPVDGGAVAEWVRALACTGDRTVLAGFESHCGKLRFGTLAIPFTPLCQCLSEETLKAVGPFYLVSMPGEVKDPTSPHWNV